MNYEDSGVNIKNGNKFVKNISKLAKETLRDEIISRIGGFSGISSFPKHINNPLLITSTDGVGTKLKLVFESDNHKTIGIDLVAMVVNDIITTGAEPLFFLDYFATGKLDLNKANDVILGIIEGCKQSNCCLIGGETAEMPDMYNQNEYDLAGFGVGVVDKDLIVNGDDVKDGDKVIGFLSSGFHSNGYSLIRKIISLNNININEKICDLDEKLIDMLLKPTKIYVNMVKKLMNVVKIKAMAHITGGGLLENPPRVINNKLAFRFFKSYWNVPIIMQYIKKYGKVSDEEMFRVFNMGIGFIVVVDDDKLDLALETLKDDNAKVVGEIVYRKNNPVELI